ncbi:ribbon-helix-helix domain-containing protein [Pantoea ananatis]|uniref:ribbon-helix-helix domain-containing protein n=1 Tax=Pantoea ananas TaxID=553 RepID=UPI000D7096D9|nr:ribbon-helix-helix domain-containing protein [Pantoea ananatis]PWV59211.1 ribbon-helix-helix CopG family protein [Pantoea ananatis]
MAITPKPKATQSIPQDQADIERFINEAPDGNKPEKRGVKKGQREQITVTFDTNIISQLDDLAQHEGLSRAALIRMAVRQLLDKGAQVGG